MMCPVCKRELAPTLSICFKCGAMVRDTVREELESKIGPVSGGLGRKPETVLQTENHLPMENSPLPARAAAPPVIASPPARPRARTAEMPKRTSPTLVEFQNRNSMLPDWRIQLQNSVRKRSVSSAETIEPGSSPLRNARAAAAAAPEKQPEPEPKVPARSSDPRLENALRRIETSRKRFFPEAGPANASAAARNYPFNVVGRTPPGSAAAHAAEPKNAPGVKPKLVSSLRIEKKGYDTNKLPPIPIPQEISSSFSARPPSAPAEETVAAEKASKPDPPVVLPRTDETDELEFDDLPPFSMRFGAGLFDLIIGGFATLIILSPLMMGGGTWFSFSGILAFTATFAIFLFLYLTASIAVWGKSFGMRLFSLELIDVEANDYPTVHQAAVNSAVYLLSLGLGGLGFLTVFLNEENRAFHDIVSGTLLIREI